MTEYYHKNGYSARLYGKSSMSIINAEGHEVLHTGFRNCNTEAEVMNVLAEMPKLQEMMKNLTAEDFDDDDCDV